MRVHLYPNTVPTKFMGTLMSVMSAVRINPSLNVTVYALPVSIYSQISTATNPSPKRSGHIREVTNHRPIQSVPCKNE